MLRLHHLALEPRQWLVMAVTRRIHEVLDGRDGQRVEPMDIEDTIFSGLCSIGGIAALRCFSRHFGPGPRM